MFLMQKELWDALLDGKPCPAGCGAAPHSCALPVIPSKLWAGLTGVVCVMEAFFQFSLKTSLFFFSFLF